MQLLTAVAFSLTLFSLASAQIQVRCTPVIDGSDVILDCTVNGAPYAGTVFYAIGEEVTINSNSESTPPAVRIPLSQFPRDRDTHNINILLSVQGQSVILTATVTIQRSSSRCNVAFVGSAVQLTCSENGQTITRTATYSINSSPNVTVNGFPVMIPISDFDPGPNSLEIFLTLTDGRVVRRALNVPVTVFSSSCEDIDDGSSFRITCTGAEGSDQIVSYTYTLNGETRTGNTFPIVINQDDLEFGVTSVTIVLTSASGLTATTTRFLVRQRLSFSVFCSASSSSDSEYIDVSCELSDPNSQTISEVTHAINDVEKGELQVNDPRNPEFRISIDDSDIGFGEENTISLFLTGSQGTQATINLPVQVRVTISARCDAKFVDGGSFLEIVCNVTGGNQGIQSVTYTVNDQSPATDGSTFRIDASLLNRETNIISITITGTRGTVVTLPDLSIIRPVFCPYFVDRANNQIVIRCESGGTVIRVSYEYTIEGISGVITGTTGVGAPIRINLGGMPNGQNIMLVLRRLDGTVLAEQRITYTSFEVSCSGSYVEAGLRITCTSPVIIASLEYTLNDGSPVIIEPVGQIEYTFVIPNADLRSTANTVIIKVTGEQGTPVELTQTFQPPTRCSYAVENGLVTIDCTGGLEGLVTIQYTFNDQTFTVSEFPVTISTSQLSQTQNNTVVLRLLRSDTTLITQTSFTITPSQFVRFSVTCNARYLRDGPDLALVISCDTLPGSTQSISSLRYTLNGGPEQEENGSTLTLSDNLRTNGNNQVTITAVGIQGATQDLQTINIPFPVTCSYAVENGLVTIDCTGGLEGLVTIQYTFNGQTFTVSEFPVTISTSQLFQTQNTTVVLRLLRSDSTLITQTSFTIAPSPFVRFSVTCNVIYIRDGPDLALVISCGTLPGSTQSISSLRYTLNGGPEREENGSTLTLSDNLRTNGNNQVTITAVGTQGATQDLQTINIPFPVTCSYAVENDLVTIDCTGGLEGLVTIQYTFNGQNFTVSEFPVTISTSQLSQTQNTTVVLRLLRSDSTLITQTSFTIAPSQFVRFSVTCGARYLRDGADLALVISCDTLPGSTQSISSLRYTLNGGPEQEENGSTLTLSDNLRTNGNNQVTITAVGTQGATQDLQTINIPFPVTCSYAVENDLVTIDCTGGLEGLVTIQYTFNDQNFTVSEFPVTISTSQLSQTQNTTVVLRLLRSDTTLITQTSFTIAPSQFVRFSVTCNARFIRDGADLALVISCDTLPGSTQSISSLRYTLNGGPEQEGIGSSITITDNLRTDVNTLTITAIGNQQAEVVLSGITVPYPITCGYTIANGLIVINCSGGLQDFVRYEYTINSVRTNSDTVFPITIDVGNQDLNPTGNNTVVLRLFSSTNELLSETTFIFQLPSVVTCDYNGVIYSVGDTFPQGDGCNTCTCTAGGQIACTLISCQQFVLECEEIVDQFFGGVRCTYSGAVGTVSFTCSYDGGPPQECDLPLVINRINFSLGEHVLLITAVDSRGSTRTFQYTFEGRSAPELILTLSPASVIVGEDGSASGDIQVTKTGYSFGEVSFSLVPLTYSEYIRLVGDNLDTLFPLRPYTSASITDFNIREVFSSFSSGLVPQPPFVVSGRGLAVSDNQPEFTEGFILYLKVDRDSLHASDRDRLQIFSPFSLVSIRNNNLPLTCRLTGDPLQTLTVSCDGEVPPIIITSTLLCRYDDIFIDCSTLPVSINTASSSSGRHTVIISGTTATGEVLAVGEAIFTVPDIDLYFINNTPVLEGGTVSAEFAADREGLEFYCHLTHLDDPGFRENCSSGSYRRTGIPTGDFTLRVIAYDPVRGDKAVIRNRLWVHSTDSNDLFCIMYLTNRGWRVSGTTFSVDFTGTGAASSGKNGQFECSLDRNKPQSCTSPLELTDLVPGRRYHVRIRPTSCGKDYRVWNKRFTVPGP